MKRIAIVAALLAAAVSAVTQAAVVPDVSVGASGVPAASSVAAPTTLNK